MTTFVQGKIEAYCGPVEPAAQWEERRRPDDRDVLQKRDRADRGEEFAVCGRVLPKADTSRKKIGYCF